MKSSKKQIIIDKKVGHVISKNSIDKISLLGTCFDEKGLYIEDLKIIINSNESIDEITTTIPYCGYYLELFLGDFNGDGKDEIMLRGKYGETLDRDIAVIYCVNNLNLIEIFNPKMFSDKYKFKAKYLKNNNVLVTSYNTQEHFVYDISNKPEKYLDMIYHEKDDVNKLKKPVISEINEAFPVKYEFKSNYYLLITQKIVGVLNLDIIGYIEGFVELLDNNIKLLKVGFCNFGEKDNVSKRSKYYISEKFPKGSNFISAVNFGYWEDKIKVDLDFDGDDECLILYTVQGTSNIGLLKIQNNKYELKSSYKGEGYDIGDFSIKNIEGKYYIFAGFKFGGNKRKLNILSYKNGELVNSFNDKGYFYSKMYMKDLDGDGNEELILWLHDTGKAYNINIYSIEENGIKHTEEYDKIYYKEVVKYYEELLKETENSSTYLYYLASAFYKIGDYKNVLLTVDKAMNTEYPYPSLSSLKDLKKKAIKNI